MKNEYRSTIAKTASYTAATAVVIAVAVWGINRVAVQNAELEVTCHLRCLQHCAMIDIPGAPMPPGLPRRLELGGPSCSEICGNQCGRDRLLPPAGQSAEPQRIFFDDFNSDMIESPPSTTPAGDPLDDTLTYTGGSNNVLVINSSVLNSNACRLDRGSTSTATIVEFVAGGGGPHVSGQYTVEWRAYAEAYESGLGILVLSSSARHALSLGLREGTYTLVSGSGSEQLSGDFLINSAHNIRFDIDLDAKLFSMFIDRAPVASDKPFVHSDFGDLRLLRFQYAPALVEAHSGIYVVDDALMERL